MQLISSYSLLYSVSKENPQLMDLRPLIAPWVPQRIRRIDRYIELCVAGGLNCVAGRKLPSDTGVYLATRCGAVTTPAQVTENIFSHCDTPMPLHFVNTLGNTAGFYLTQLLNTCGNTLVVSQEHLSFEAALLHAWLDIQQRRVSMALVGGFDEITLPFLHQAKRLDAPDATSLTEGSHWLLLGANDAANADVTLQSPEYFADISRLCEWLRGKNNPYLQCAFIPTGIERELLHNNAQLLSDFIPDGIAHGVFSGAAIIALCTYISDRGGTGLHIMRDRRGGYASVVISKP